MPLTDHMPAREMDDVPSQLDYDEIALSPSLRDREYLAHSSLLGTMLGSYGGRNPIILPSLYLSADIRNSLHTGSTNDKNEIKAWGAFQKCLFV